MRRPCDQEYSPQQVPMFTLLEKKFGESVQEIQQELSAVILSSTKRNTCAHSRAKPGLMIVRRYIGSRGRVLEVSRIATRRVRSRIPCVSG